ncbi:MAG: cytidine deaminase [Planctomycetaceae bacterium]|nr:cytidine deaminase [Planctomycetaceae bacterium]
MASTNNDFALLTAACNAMKNSHSPYSKYPVGAAVLDSGGSIYTGCNVENAAFGSTICAEAAAVANAFAAGSTRPLVAIAVITSTGGMPCGNCRQILAEVAPDCQIFIATPQTLATPHETTLSAILPNPFTRLS